MARHRRSSARAGKRIAALVRAVPADYVLRRRELFSFHRPTKGPDGRTGEIDQDICDGIGQLHALGLLDVDGVDAIELRNAGRMFAQLYWMRYHETGPRTGRLEREDRSTSMSLVRTAADDIFDTMDVVLTGFERRCVMELAIDTYWGDAIAPWAQALIDEGLRGRGRERIGQHTFVTSGQRRRLAGCLVGLCRLANWRRVKVAA